MAIVPAPSLVKRLQVKGPLDHPVDLWWSRLSSLAMHRDMLTSVLSCDEHRRAAGYKVAKPRERYCSARGALRVLLASYLQCEPFDVALVEGTHGKPMLAQCGAADIQFNLSHSGDVVVYAISAAAEVGVDVEQLDRDLEREMIVARSFSTAERESYLASAPDDRLMCFFRLWTQKEARAKASGTGLDHCKYETDALPVAHFDIENSYVGALAWRHGRRVDIQTPSPEIRS